MAIQSLRGLRNRIRSRLPQRLVRILRDIPPITAIASGVLVLLLLLSMLLPEPPDELPVPPQPTENRYSAQTEYQATAKVSTALPQQAERSAAAEQSPPPLLEEARPSSTSQTVVAKPSTVSVPPLPRQTKPELSANAVAVPPSRWKQEAWLLEQRPEAYSIQILAAGSEVAIRTFLQQHKLDKDVYYFESRRNGRPWFPVLHGIYKNRTAAMAALDKLPETLSKAGAWPRSLSSIQKEIKQER